MNKEKFIEKSMLIHVERFDYTLFEYKNSITKSKLICNICGVEFLTTPSNNLTGSGCKNCHDISKIDKSEILKKLENKNKNWIFNIVDYKNRDSDISYTCNRGHNGISSYRNMIRYNVCKECDKLNLLENKRNRIEDNNLTILEYNSDKDISCKCNNCNYIITMGYRSFTYEKYKCKYCELLKISELLKNKSLNLLEIKGNTIKLKCKEGHTYNQSRGNLLSGIGCYKCYLENKTIKKEGLLSTFKNIHGDYFTYNIDNYSNIQSKINITCRKGHNFIQKASNHLQGKGCSICRESIGERLISIYLDKIGVNYERQKKFKDCKYKGLLPFDFYISDWNILIEYDGIQHFKPVGVFGGEEEFEKTKIRDKIKNEYCLNKNIHLIRISYLENIEDKLSNINKLIVFQS